PFQAIVHVHERARLLSITPYVDNSAVCRQGYFAAHRSWRFFPTAIKRSQRPIHVVKTHDASLDLIIPPVIQTELFGVKFFPAVSRLRIGGKGVGLFPGGHLRVPLL